MEFAAMVRSVLKLSAGIQLALRSSLGRVRLPLPAGTGTHCYAHSWQASPKTWEKNLVILECSFHKMLSKGEKRKRKRKTPFHVFWAKDIWGNSVKFIQYAAQNIIYMCCVWRLSYLHCHKRQSKTDKKASGVPITGYMLILSRFGVCAFTMERCQKLSTFQNFSIIY